MSRRLVIEQPSEHLDCREGFLRGVLQSLVSRDVRVRAQSRAADLFDPAQQCRRHVEQLIRLFVKKQLHRLRHDLGRKQRPNPVTIDR